ncbi:ubiquitin conjugation factor E4 A [Venturia canescens]|uniref:ubiquitin conjugation factor E4 A n=1 Tax=Venturia canescens TaxID=32260 RepID=UPI001C9BEE73|nr:ubiquitin conjugation factor E4 A [Venturia canescens]XP_043272470.1 ubiquitin conjugation factor E4 A [Venturia canescens]
MSERETKKVKMCDKVKDNPFAALFSSSQKPVSFSSQQTVTDEQEKSPEIQQAPTEQIKPKDTAKKYSADDLLAEAFGLTTNPINEDPLKKYLVYVDAQSAEDAIFERLMFTDLKSRLVPPCDGKKWTCDSHTVETEIIPYLFESFCRLRKKKQCLEIKETRESLEKIALRNVSTALQVPNFFPGQEVHSQFACLFKDFGAISNDMPDFMTGILAELDAPNLKPDDDTLISAFSPILDYIKKEAETRNLLTFSQCWFDLLLTFASFEPLAKLIISHSSPEGTNGRVYSQTLLGVLFSYSCLPDDPQAQFIFFDKPLEQVKSAFEGNIWTALDSLCSSLHLLLHTLLKLSPEVRHMTLTWLGKCLNANAIRGKIWNTQHDLLSGLSSVSDGFMLNLGTVMLRLCQPFCAKFNDVKALKIDPTYCSLEAKDEAESRNRGLHMQGMSSETCLVPTNEGETRLASESFGFVTECFFITHRTLDLGYRVVLGKLMRANQDLARVQRLLADIQENDPPMQQYAFKQMEKETIKYMSLRASLLAPEMLNLLSIFHATTAFWLIQVNLDIDADSSKSSTNRVNYAPRELKDVTFPLPETVPNTVKCVPEFVVENTVGFVCFIKRLSPNTFEEQGPNFLNPILTEILALMGSPKRLYNPHLRARLAEGLEALLPTNEDANQPRASLGSLYREMLFLEHPHRQQIVPNLLHVFVSIEMTGQSVEFEQKFNYRRPMYIVMDYIWKLDEHRNIFKNLAEEAERNMEAVQPPLFLRFINLSMNDAVFLLDEALTNMAQLKQLLQARENGEWENLPRQERDQQTSNLQRIGMIARFDNILGRETINTFKMLTTEIKSIFCHPTMVDRIASMLNYLLLQLVGPNSRNLKVKDQKEYEFNPATLVLNICEIYINLSENENFTLAVSQDGRSYTSELFDLAENVLVRIGGVGILGDLSSFAKRVKKAASIKKAEDELLNNAPDDYLDPIMSTLMIDPVILPSSKITVDRQTIARHLLSDQTDPFNRSPLTMDMVKSNTELRAEIEDWIKQRKAECSSTSNAHQ